MLRIGTYIDLSSVADGDPPKAAGIQAHRLMPIVPAKAKKLDTFLENIGPSCMPWVGTTAPAGFDASPP